MIGMTLIEIREHIDDLATEDGQYYVVCGRTGDRPVPAADNRFPDRSTARAAARATEQYRSALRRYDPQVPYYELIVCEETARDATRAQPRESAAETPQLRLSKPVRIDSSTAERRDRIEFCHRVVGAVFGTLSKAGHDEVERAAMDSYFKLAETLSGPDELCICLLESMAVELDERLSPADQAETLSNAVARLEPVADSNNPLEATLTSLEQWGLITGYTRSPWSVNLDDGARSVVVRISGYALPARNNRLPVLPLTLELCRHQTKRLPQFVRVTAIDGGWQLRFVLTDTVGQDGLVNAPIDGEA